jgi:hypothetical protein
VLRGPREQLSRAGVASRERERALVSSKSVEDDDDVGVLVGVDAHDALAVR